MTVTPLRLLAMKKEHHDATDHKHLAKGQPHVLIFACTIEIY